MPSEPTAAAGRSIGEALLVLTTVDWSKHITAIEAEAAAAERAAIRAEVAALRNQIPTREIGMDAELTAAADTLVQIVAILDAREPKHE